MQCALRVCRKALARHAFPAVEILVVLAVLHVGDDRDTAVWQPAHAGIADAGHDGEGTVAEPSVN